MLLIPFDGRDRALALRNRATLELWKCASVRLLCDITSFYKKDTSKYLYGKEGDVVSLISVHDDMLLVRAPVTYTFEKLKGFIPLQRPSTFAVHKRYTNYDNVHAQALQAKALPEPELVPNKRPSYGAPTVGRRRK